MCILLRVVATNLTPRLPSVFHFLLSAGYLAYGHATGRPYGWYIVENRRLRQLGGQDRHIETIGIEDGPRHPALRVPPVS